MPPMRRLRAARHRRHMITAMPREKRLDVAAARVRDELLIRNALGTALHQLNATAAFVWHDWDGQKTSADIAGLLATRFDVSLGIARRDVAQVVQQLRDLDLL